MTEVTSRPQSTQPSERCLTRTAPSGAPTAARVASWRGKWLPLTLGDTTILLGRKQCLLLAVLKRHMGRAVSHQFLWRILYDERPFRCPASGNSLRPIVHLARRQLPPEWRITTVDGFGYYLEKVTE